MLKRSAVVSFALGLVSTAVADDPYINLGYINLRGNATLPGVHFFGGIPYIQPPVGDLRFIAPVALDEKNKANPPLHDGRNWGPICIQQPAVVGIGSEGAVVFTDAQL